MYLGIKAVITKSFARIHLANLINFGIVPFTFVEESDYDRIDQEDDLEIDVSHIEKLPVVLKNKTKGITIPLSHSLSERDMELIKAGGSLAYAKKQLDR
jgi:aconitate hydratase